MTCWRRLAYWTKTGVWPRLHELLLAELEGAGRIDWRRGTIDSSHVRARGGGEGTGPSPVDRRKRGSKHFVVTDAQGIPLAATTTAANYPDVKAMESAVDAVPPVRGKPGRPKRRPKEMYADRAFDSAANRVGMRRRSIRPRIAKIRAPQGSGLGKRRRVSQRTLSWLHNFGRLRVRKDHTAAIHQAFFTLVCVIIFINVIDHGQLC
jgi:transposase